MGNPYSGVGFFEFFQVFIGRLLSGEVIHPVSDEIQILVLMGVALSGGIVGTFLVLRNMTMLSNAISHTILVGIVGAYLLLFSWGTLQDSLEGLSLLHLTLASLLAGLLTTLVTEFLNKVTLLQEDAAVGLVFTSLFALGVFLVTLFTKNLHLGSELVMGNVDISTSSDLKIVYGVLGLNAALIFLFYKEFKITTFDSGLAHSFGISTGFFNLLLMILTSATVMSALRAVGVLMVLGFLVGPTLIARLFTRTLSSLLFLSCGLGIAASFMGVALSRHILSATKSGLSTGGLVMCTIVFLFILAILTKRHLLRHTR